MRNKLYWGLGILIVLLIGAFVFVMVNQHAEIKQLEAEAKKAQDKANQIKEQDALKNNPPVAREGFKMVPHGDHWHEVPIDAPDTWQGEPHGEVGTKDDIPAQTYDGPLTYHEELLETNPVKALRLQQEERGHWSAKYIPPFPTDDTEAQNFARIVYLVNYYVSIGDTDNPVFEKVGQEGVHRYRDIASYPSGARKVDLMRLSWPFLEFDSDIVFAPYESNYFTYTGELKPEYAELVK
ncbi:hypothetical protein F4083_02665 [Candidatus Poribacteria bacterium]|nr:hypothetical protein [Candidatus Poribacteria bacterium]MYF57342.1 hypothetical protein [Candidatus Poribacteria bacterium]MYI93214.1 hypothetical protein [Candidatus Poribacteria bacterium]